MTPGSLHLYAYCANNPVNYVDPSGHYAQAIAYQGGKYLVLSGVVSAGTLITVGGVLLTVTVAVGIVYHASKKYRAYKAEHRTTKNGSKKKTNDKHTKKRPGRASEKKKQIGNWKLEM